MARFVSPKRSRSSAATRDKIADRRRTGNDFILCITTERERDFGEQVPDDRLGLRHSVMGRMERHGGRATVRSDPETGTEVRLEMDR